MAIKWLLHVLKPWIHFQTTLYFYIGTKNWPNKMRSFAWRATNVNHDCWGKWFKFNRKPTWITPCRFFVTLIFLLCWKCYKTASMKCEEKHKALLICFWWKWNIWIELTQRKNENRFICLLLKRSGWENHSDKQEKRMTKKIAFLWC